MNKIEQRYRAEVEKIEEYKYIRSFRKGDVLPSGNLVKHSPYIQVMHMYCGSIYEVNASGFINSCKRCSHCCGSYEASFAHYIEQELGLDINDVWDFEKNIVNPYHISKNRNAKDLHGNDTRVWIKCLDKEYHGSYEVSCANFVRGQRCGYCNPTGKSPKIHPRDSFAQWGIDNIGNDFLNDTWDVNKNTGIDPWKTSTRSDSLKVWIKCNRCNNSYLVTPIHFTKSGSRCPDCKSSKGENVIGKWLISQGITFISDKEYFKDLTSEKGKPLRPDFILPDHKIWIEYDGEFHYRDIMGGLKTQQLHDKLKDRYARKHGWKMIRIPYWDFDKIEEILKVKITIEEGEKNDKV